MSLTTPAATVYVSLLDEGTEVWRPVSATRDGDVFLILGPMPEEERWQFPPGSRVHCALKEFSDGTTHLVAYRLLAAALP
jgi:hypothetical protein